MANDDRDHLLKVADQLELAADQAFDRGMEFATIAGGDPSSALADFISAGALCGAAQKARKRAEDAG